MLTLFHKTHSPSGVHSSISPEGEGGDQARSVVMAAIMRKPTTKMIKEQFSIAAMMGVIAGAIASFGLRSLVSGITHAYSGWRITDTSATPIGGSAKRLFDVVAVSVALVLLAPLMLLVAALIKYNMGGPVIFTHRRIGVGGSTFGCYKFRTMVVNGDAVLANYLESNPAAAEEWAVTRKLMHDPRVTWLGRVLRKTSIDELPQLFNILLGEMSCVGPRPIVQDELERYGSNRLEYVRARPGLTGLWQVSGRSRLNYSERVQLDAQYVTSWSFLGDLKIILLTFPAVLAYSNAV